MTLVLVVGVVGCGLALALCTFGLWRNEKVAAYFHAVNDHVYRTNIAAIMAGTPTLDWAVLAEAREHWDQMIFMPWKPLAAWFPPEYRP